MPKFKNWNEYLDDRGNLVEKPGKTQDYSGPNPQSPEKGDTNNNPEAPKQSSAASPYRAAGSDPGMSFSFSKEEGLANKGAKELIYNPKVDVKSENCKDGLKHKKEDSLGDKGEKKLKYEPNTDISSEKVIADRKTKTEQFIDDTKDMSLEEFAQYMKQKCGHSDDVTNIHPSEAMSYIVNISKNNSRVLENLTYEMKKNNLLGNLLESLLEHRETYDELARLMNESENGSTICKALHRSINAYNESVAPPIGLGLGDESKEDELDEPCPECGGEGCPACEEPNDDTEDELDEPCPECGGEGCQACEEPCPDCNGEGCPNCKKPDSPEVGMDSPDELGQKMPEHVVRLRHYLQGIAE